MVWFRSDDNLLDHPKWISLPDAAKVLWHEAGMWASRHLTDGAVPPTYFASRPGSLDAARSLVRSGLWERARGGGFQFHDWADWNPTREKVERDRKRNVRRQALFRDPALKEAIRRRDGDHCRYCHVAVKWGDRKGPYGGTYDHIDPDGPNSIENLVVACRACNSAKCDRTLEEAGMTLRQPFRVTSYDPVSSNVPTRPDPPPKGGEGRRRATPAARADPPADRCDRCTYRLNTADHRRVCGPA